jgi:DNA gyrase subunit B
LFHSDEGLKEFIRFLDANREPITADVISMEGEKNDIPVESSYDLQYFIY